MPSINGSTNVKDRLRRRYIALGMAVAVFATHDPGWSTLFADAMTAAAFGFVALVTMWIWDGLCDFVFAAIDDIKDRRG